MARRIIIDVDECTGCESCAEVCPDVFGFDTEQEKAYIKKLGGGPEEEILEAIESCPVDCIQLEED